MPLAYVDHCRAPCASCHGGRGRVVVMQLEADTKVVPPRSADEPPKPAAPRPAAEPLVLQRWVGRYELIHRLAHGGMATVYLGRAKGKAGFEKIVAVKVIHPHLASEDEFVGMFLDEARIAARIHHPHVVEILDLGQHEGVYYMVMEFIEGENLAALVRALDGELLPVRVILQLVADTLEGLAAAHELRDADGERYELVHRDVSPQNILINLDGWAKVADFGIMKAAGKASNTKTGELRGKLAYMSPEQARGNATVDRRTDLFALTVIIWELLTGRRLFACTSEAATLEKVMACEIPALGTARAQLDEHPKLRAALETLLARGLASEPQQRHPDAHEMLTEVRALQRLADDRLGTESEPRAYLGKLMQRFFQGRVDYARAALRRTGEYEALVEGAREWQVEHTTPVARPPSGEFPVGARVPTGSQPGLGERPRLDTATYPSMVAPPNRLAQWSMWLLLPMLGAGIAIVVMLWLGPRFAEQGVNPSDPAAGPPLAESTSSSAEDRTPATGLTTGRPAPSELAAMEYAPAPQRAPGTVSWWFTSKPSKAKLFIDGEYRGTTPLDVTLPSSEQPVDVRLELEGHETQNLTLRPTNDQNFLQQLQPLVPASTKGGGKRKVARPKASEAESTDTKADPKKAFVPVPESLRE